MSRVLRVGFALAASALCLPSIVRAQGTPGTDTAFDVQTYWPAGGPGEHLVSRGTTVSPSGAVGFGLIVGFMRQPLVLRPLGAQSTSPAVDWAVTTDFVWSVGLANRFQLSAAVPMVIAQSGTGTQAILGSRGAALGDTALRDLRLEASWAIVQRERMPDATGLGLRLDLGGAIPFGDEAGFNSAGGFTFAPMLAADYRLRRVTVTVNAGARIRADRRFADMIVGNALVASAGVAVRPLRRLNLSVEYFTTVGLASAAGLTSPMTGEVFGGARLATDAAGDVELLAGVAVPVLSDPLNPGWRGLVGLSYAPRGNDRDRDGVLDADDRCIDVAEDRDDFEDEDGCVDADNDGDGVPDTADRCPNEPEDADNHEDADGCPDEDNDGDTVADADDECPMVPAGEHPDAARNGCPIPDTDSDGVLDPDDQCVDVAAGSAPDPQRAGCPIPDSDGDGVRDDQDTCPNVAQGDHPDPWRPGCADPDPDRDGVMGEADRCADQPETINGVTDTDGCPDTGVEAVTWDAAGDALRFAAPVVVPPTAAALAPAPLAIVRQAAQRIRARGNEVVRVFVEVMPAAGAPAQAVAQRQAEVVRDVLIGQRIPAALLTVQPAARPAANVRPPVGARPIAPGTLILRVERRPAPAARP
jgi:OOP family OmpA-OmpF porin